MDKLDIDTLRLSIQQNYLLISYAGSIAFFIMMLSGQVSNMFLNMLFVVGLLYDTIPVIANKNTKLPATEPVYLLKCWVTLCSMILAEYMFCSIINVGFLNIFLNVSKLILFTALYSSVPILYDLYISKFYDKLGSVSLELINNFTIVIPKDSEVTTSQYDLIHIVRSFFYPSITKKID